MSRKAKISAKDIQRSRRDWYLFHFENRQTIKAISDDMLRSYQYIAGVIKPPHMTVYGGVSEDWPERKAYELCNKFELDVNLINPWYLSDSGWQALQELWQQLPEPVNLSTEGCVQVGELYTVSTVERAARPPDRRQK